MNFLQRILSGVSLSFGLRQTQPSPIQRLNFQPVVQQDSKVMPRLTLRIMPQAEMSVKELSDAIAYAEDPIMLDRTNLYALYKEVARDGYLRGVLRVHQNNILCEGWDLVDDKGNSDEKAHKLLERAWFQDFLRKCIETSLWGHSLLEPIIVNKEVVRLQLIPREHVSPERGNIYIYPIVGMGGEGIPFREKPFSDYLIELGEQDDLGLLQYAAKHIIRKEYSDKDWGQHSERYGMPIVDMATDEVRKEELDKKQSMLENLGSNGWLMRDKEDEVKLLESTKANAHLMYSTRMDRADQLINLLIVGSSTLGQEKSFVGAAEVSERIADKFKLAQMRDIQYAINDKLLPWLAANGYPMAGREFRFNSLYEEDQDGGNAAPNVGKTPGAPTPGGDKKKSLSASSLPIQTPGGAVGATLAAAPDRLFELYLLQLAEDIHAERFSFEQWLEDATVQKLTRLTLNDLYDAFVKAFVRPEADWSIEDRNLVAKVYQNVSTFSGAKTYAQLLDLRNAVYDGETLRSWTSFRQIALDLNAQYNLDWLATERQAIMASGTMASKWIDIQANKDLYPYLMYVTVGDARVRDTHKAMDGIIRPVDDPFWRDHYPPNGWNCRCSVAQIDANDLTDEGGITDAQEASDRASGNTDPYWRGNVGQSGLIFKETSTYFSGMSKTDKQALRDEAQRQWDQKSL